MTASAISATGRKLDNQISLLDIASLMGSMPRLRASPRCARMVDTDPDRLVGNKWDVVGVVDICVVTKRR
jgi:hypothetical protein